MPVDALRWPRSMSSPTDLQKVLMGFPFFGPDRRAYREFRRQVAARPETCLDLWKQDEATRQARDRLFKLLREEMDWEVPRFVPEDPCQILFFDPSMNLRSGCAMLRIEELLGREIDMDRLIKMTLGDLVDDAVAAGSAS
jgi:hypothetical protein